MPNLSIQTAQALFSNPRLGPYLREVGQGNESTALELYQWGTELEGAFHATLSFLEIALRNSIDTQLQKWNSENSHRKWTTPGETREEIRNIAGRGLKSARKYAKEELERKHNTTNIIPSHDDILAQFTFGNLSYFFIDPGGHRPPVRQDIRQTLWQECLKDAFPDLDKPVDKRICNTPDGLIKIGNSLEHLRRLRNKVAHHDNLLQVDVRRQIHAINSVLGKIDPELPGFAMAKSQLRRLRNEDPRRRLNLH